MQPPDSRSPKIGAVVSQAKETASALWVLLHARQCTDDQCRLIHCANAKGIFSLSRAASTGVKLNDHQSAAVAEARKLLLHFKECRQSRLTTNAEEEEDEETSTLQASSSSSSENPPQRPSPPVCLVCSLVARARPATQTTTTGTVAGENILLDFSNSPYDPSLPSPSLHLPLHGHGTRSGGRRRASSLSSIDDTFPMTSLGTSSSSSNSKSITKQKNKRTKTPSSRQAMTQPSNDVPTLGPAEGDWGFGSIDMGNSTTASTTMHPPQPPPPKPVGRSRSSSLSALTSEDQLGASVLSTLFSGDHRTSHQASNAKRPRSVSWGNELGGRTDDAALGTPNWMMNNHRNVALKTTPQSEPINQASSSTSSSSTGVSQVSPPTTIDQDGYITDLPSVGHIASFRRPLVSLSRPSSCPSSPTLNQLSGPKSPPSLAKLADAVERSIASPTSMLGYIEPHHPSSQLSSQSVTNHVMTVEQSVPKAPPLSVIDFTNTKNTNNNMVDGDTEFRNMIPPPAAPIPYTTQVSPDLQPMDTPVVTHKLSISSEDGDDGLSESPHKQMSLMKLADIVVNSDVDTMQEDHIVVDNSSQPQPSVVSLGTDRFINRQQTSSCS